MDFYFSRFEHRRPPEPLSTPRWVRMIWQVLTVAALVLGANYYLLALDRVFKLPTPYGMPFRWRWRTLAWIGTSPVHHKFMAGKRSSARRPPDGD